MKRGISQRYVHLIFAAFVVGVLSVCFSPNAQSRTKASGPRPTPTPSHLSVELEGAGALVPTSAACDANGTCLGMLTAALTGLPSAASLSLEISLNNPPIPNSPVFSPPCYITNGSGTLGTFGVSFEGKFCTDGVQYTLSGTLSRGILFDKVCQTAPQMVMAAELTVYGANSPSGPLPPPGFNPIPSGASGAIANIVGSVGQIPDPCPSP
jgi:hypothetical protein